MSLDVHRMAHLCASDMSQCLIERRTKIKFLETRIKALLEQSNLIVVFVLEAVPFSYLNSSFKIIQLLLIPLIQSFISIKVNDVLNCVWRDIIFYICKCTAVTPHVSVWIFIY